MDKLSEVADYHKKNLEGKQFRLQAGKRTVIELDILFGAEHFKHLSELIDKRQSNVYTINEEEVLQHFVQ